MAWFRPAKKPKEGDDAPPAPSTDTVGNPILERRARGRHVAESEPGPGPGPGPDPTRAEHRVLQFVAEGRVARTAVGGAAAALWRVDGAFVTGPKAMMLDWLLEQGFIAFGERTRVADVATITEEGRAVLEHRA